MKRLTWSTPDTSSSIQRGLNQTHPNNQFKYETAAFKCELCGSPGEEGEIKIFEATSLSFFLSVTGLGLPDEYLNTKY